MDRNREAHARSNQLEGRGPGKSYFHLNLVTHFKLKTLHTFIRFIYYDVISIKTCLPRTALFDNRDNGCESLMGPHRGLTLGNGFTPESDFLYARLSVVFALPSPRRPFTNTYTHTHTNAIPPYALTPDHIEEPPHERHYRTTMTNYRRSEQYRVYHDNNQVYYVISKQSNLDQNNRGDNAHIGKSRKRSKVLGSCFTRVKATKPLQCPKFDGPPQHALKIIYISEQTLTYFYGNYEETIQIVYNLYQTFNQKQKCYAVRHSYKFLIKTFHKHYSLPFYQYLTKQNALYVV